MLAVSGCGHFRPKPTREFVYVSAKETFLRDRVAAVTNRVAEVTNGQRLQVLEHGRRFLKVKTDKNEIGWIEEHSIIDQKIYDAFSALKTDHAHDPVIVTAVLRDDSNLHDAPGRKTDHFYLLPANDRLQLLVRASVLKPVPPQALMAPQTPVPAKKPALKKHGKAGEEAPDVPAGPPMEDYWLIRDQQGLVGWIRARALDVDVPDAIAGLAEGQRMVGAYVLKTVDDPGSSFPNGQAPEYIAVFSPYKDGLPYDFDQVRVFTWNAKKHRYETAYRERNIEGFLPVTVEKDPANPEVPIFSWKMAQEGTATIDPQTGIAKPGQTTVASYRLEGVVVRSSAAAAAAAQKAAAKPVAAAAQPPEEARKAGHARRHRAEERRERKKKHLHPAQD